MRFAQSCILGRLRNQTFFSLAETNAAIGHALDRINDHVMRRLGVSRRQLFESVERLALASLPLEDYEFAEWRLARISSDYHVGFKDLLLFRAPQPHSSAGRSESNGAHHRDLPPRQARRGASSPLWRSSPWNAQFPPALYRMDTRALSALSHVDRAADRRSGHCNSRQPSASRAGLSNMSGHPTLFRDIERNRGEAVSARAVEIGGLNCKSIASLIANHKAARHSTEPTAIVDHANLRGPDYFH
ncbi:hypothetical protein [Mesorhizobium sp. M0185]|uniref:hypothetical protein n=1 Tax=Mesorhizobium sp. M0185 TaxID=2956907 RepID=UPI0033360E9A